MKNARESMDVRPSAMATREAKARCLAFASETTGHPPRPMSCRFPSMTTRWTQLFEPPGATFRYSVSPSPYLRMKGITWNNPLF